MAENTNWHHMLGIIFVINSMFQRGYTGMCYQRSSTTVDCSNSGLLRVPADIPTNTTSLNLTINNITTLYNHDFHHVINLRYLYLSLNPISTIQDMAFEGLSMLLNLEIFGHHLNYSIQSLPVNVFNPLESLASLSLRSHINHLHILQPNISGRVFENLSNLTELVLDTTKSMVFSNEFSRLSKLNRLIVGTTYKLGESFHCGLAEISNATFLSLSTLPINYIDFHDCVLHRFDSMSLKPLPSLQTFIFSGVRFVTGNLSGVIEALAVYQNKTMAEISINNFYSNHRYLGSGWSLSLATLSKICVTYLDLSDNDIIYMDFDVLLELPVPPLTRCIKYLYLKGNKLTGRITRINMFFLMTIFTNLEKIDVSVQKIFKFNHFESMGTNADEVNIERFPIGYPIVLPSKLRYFNIAGMPERMGELHDVYIFNGDNLEYLNVSYCGIYDFYRKVVGLKNLISLDLSGNDMSILSEQIFDTFPNLTHLGLSHVFLDNYFITQYGKRLLKPLRKLENLDLSNNGLVVLPYDIFQPLVAIQVISLVNNKLLNVPDVSSLVTLNHLHLSYNSLTTINARYRTMFDITSQNNKQFHLSIYGNTFSCTCSSVQFLLWIQGTNVALDGRNYSCMDMDGQITTTGAVAQRFSYFHRQCSSKFWLNMATGGLSLLLLVIITVFVFAKNKMKFQLILLRMIGQNVCPRRREEYAFDAAVIDTPITYSFVSKSLFGELETIRRIKLNISNRDRNPSHAEPRTIAEAISDSWKVVLILTDEFLQSKWASFTMCHCLSAITLTTPDRLILLIHKDTRIPVKIDFLLEAVSENNILHVNVDEPLSQEFWNKLNHMILQTESNQ